MRRWYLIPFLVTTAACATRQGPATNPLREVGLLPHVQEIRSTYHDDMNRWDVLRGVEIYVPRTHDAGRLRESLHAHLAARPSGLLAGGGAADDPLRPDEGQVEVTVLERGDQLAVQVTASNERVAYDVLRRARRLVRAD
jgi:hypothetical protein